MIADDLTREAMHLLEARQGEAALLTVLGLDGTRIEAFQRLLSNGRQANYQEALAILTRDAEGTCFVYRFSDPTYVMMEALLQAIGQQCRPLPGRWLDLCGGTGHLTRALSGLGPAEAPVLADVFFWKLWLARRFTAPECVPVCCDANQPLPFAREAFSLVLLADAFPYIWHKRLLAEEMMRLSTSGGVIALPHLHSALGENFSAGNTLTPNAYLNLFARLQPRLFSDQLLLTQVLESRVIDLTQDRTAEELATEPSLTLIAGGGAELVRRYQVANAQGVTGELKVNPLYRIELRGGSSFLTLTFPTPEYEEEFGECRRYLPETLTIEADLTGAIAPEMLGSRGDELRRRRVILDAPPHYC